MSISDREVTREMEDDDRRAEETMVKLRMRNAIQDLANARNRLEDLVSRTPSGETRNRLCDANIHVGAAAQLLGDLL